MAFVFNLTCVFYDNLLFPLADILCDPLFACIPIPGTNIPSEGTRYYKILMMQMFFILLSAGWIGNSAISPIIGERDPYYTVSARVGLGY